MTEKKTWNQETKNVGETAVGNSGSGAQRASLFHIVQSDTMQSAVSRVTSESDYSHTDKTCCPTSKKKLVTVEKNPLAICPFCFQRIQGQKTK